MLCGMEVAPLFRASDRDPARGPMYALATEFQPTFYCFMCKSHFCPLVFLEYPAIFLRQLSYGLGFDRLGFARPPLPGGG